MHKFIISISISAEFSPQLKSRNFSSCNLTDFRLCVELPIKAKKFGLKYRCIPSFERSRIGGEKKVNEFKDGFLILMTIFL